VSPCQEPQGGVVASDPICCNWAVPGAAENFYRGEAGRAYQQEKRAVPAEAFPWIGRLRAQKFQSHIEPTDTVLELGAGFGWNLAQLRCARRVATDLEDHLPADLKKSGVEFLRTSTALLPESIDVIICHHVLEHVSAPPSMLAECARLLRPTGRLLLNVPFEKERRYRRFDPAEPNHHLYSWNVQTLGNLLSLHDFQIEQIALQKFGYDRAAAAMALRLKLGEGGFRLIRRFALLLKPAHEIAAVARKKSG
jgi:SAM-dependent methyltransferase